MSINFYEGKDGKPDRLFLASDRVTIHDRIVFTETYYASDDNCVSFYGILSPESVGIENSKDKAWKFNNQKVLLNFYKAKKPTWNNETKKFEDKEVDASENYLYTFAKDVLKNIDSKCVSASVAPYVSPEFLDSMKTPQPEAVIAYWENRVKNTVVAVKVEPKILTESDADFVNISSNTKGSKTYQKPESESEKLEARWNFLKQHLKEYNVNSLDELGVLLAMPQIEHEGLEAQQALKITLELISKMWK